MNQDVLSLERMLKALADTTRLRILALMLTGEVCVCNLHESLRIPQSKASRHLAYLRRAGLVETRRRGLWVYYRLSTLPDPVLQTVRDVVMHGLGHIDSCRRDARRLQTKTGCCAPASTRPGTVVCGVCCDEGPGTTRGARASGNGVSRPR